MKKLNIFIVTIVLVFFLKSLSSQNYSTLKIKEEFDIFNIQEANSINVCSNPSEGSLGDSFSFLLDSYITMYKTTKDKAYLHKFILQTLCLMQNRVTIPSPFRGTVQLPLWSQSTHYFNGYIIGALARFVYLIKVEEPSLANSRIYPFPEYVNFNFRNPYYYPDPTPPDDPNDPIQHGFKTFWLFADWLAYRVDQTLDWYIGTGEFHNVYGILRTVSETRPFEINMQIGFGRAAMYQGYTDPNTSAYTPRGRNIASNYFNQINFFDNCNNIAYNQTLLRDIASNNSYWWYHRGWAFELTHCFNHQNVKNYYYYVEFVEDMSHGRIDINFAQEYYKMQPALKAKFAALYPPGFFDVFYDWQMTKFKNTFTKNLFNGNINNVGFNNAVDGAQGIISSNFGNSPPPNTFALSSLGYMPLEEYDDGDGYSVYNIIMNYYRDNISTLTTKPNLYNGFHNKGHADVVAAQWKHECTNLELYNRNVVYNQDFFAKNKLIITPQTVSNLPGGLSYAEPIISTKEFIVQPNVTVNMWGGESVTLKPGVQIKNGSTFKAFVAPSACTDGARMASGNLNNSGEGKNHTQASNNLSEEKSKMVTTQITFKPRAVPNPFSTSTNIQFTLTKAGIVCIKVLDNLGRVVYQSAENINYNQGFNEITIPTANLVQGLYSCVLNIDNETVQTLTIVKQ